VRSADTLPIERLQQALSHLRVARGTSPQVPARLPYEFGKSRLANGEPEEARALLAPRTTAGYSLMPAADRYLGQALEALGRRQEATVFAPVPQERASFVPPRDDPLREWWLRARAAGEDGDV
jgi:hypothetical protein